MLRRLLPTTRALPAPPDAAFAALACGVLAYGGLLAAGATTLHDWLAPVLYFGIAALVGARAARVEPDRTAWLLLAGGLVAYGIGSLVFVAAGGADRATVPWTAHVAWLAFYPLAYAAVVALVRARVPALAPNFALDGVIGAFTLAAIAAIFLGDDVGTDFDAISGLAYLQGDVLLVVVLLWSGLIGGRGGRRMWLVLAAGVTLVLASDLWAATTDLGAVGDRLSRTAYPAGMLLLAVAAWQEPAPRGRIRADSLTAISLPAACVAVLLVLLGVELAAPDVVPEVGHALIVAALAVAAVRAVLSYRQLSRFRDSRRYQRGFEDAAIGMALISAGDVRWVRVNVALCQMLGRPAEQLVGRKVSEFLAPDAQVAPETVAKGREGGDRIDPFERIFLHADGHSRVEAQVTSVLVDEEEDEPYFFSQIRDLTIRNRARRRGAALAELGRLALDVRAPDALLRAALPKVRAAMGAAGCTVAGPGDADAPDALGVPLRGRTDVEERPQLLVVRRPGGGFDEDDVRFVQAAADILSGALDRADAEAELRRRALEDPLTGLANRTFLTGHLEHELASTARGEGPLALLLLDVDRFKTINDTLGHNAGDALLKQVAARLTDRMRQVDVVARLGGDEFVVACGRLNGAAEAATLAQRVVDAFGSPFEVEGRQLHLATSVGVAVATDRDATPGALLRDADTAMYRAKERGGGRFELFDAELRARVVERLEIEHALRGAIERAEMRVEFQPVVALDGDVLSGFEALVRWEHPERGRIAPCAFIPIAEDTDLIRPIGRWVIEQALHASVRWNAGRPVGAALRVGVNLSPRELVPDLVAYVQETAEEVGADVRTLMFEITEGLLVQGEAARTVISALRALGCETSLDDFGTGYSSLAAVDEYDLDVVKLDRSLMAGLGESARAEGLVRAAVGMASALGVRVLAEGLETETQVRAAQALGCDFGQGWYWAPSLPFDEATALVERSAMRRLAPARPHQPSS